MALSGTIKGTTNNEFVSCKIVWSASQSISGNYTDVTATLSFSRTNTGYTTSGTFTGNLYINGVATAFSKYASITYNSNTVICTATTRVYHNDDGSKSITISATGGRSSPYLGIQSCSATVTLDTIPRASSISVGTLTMNSSGSISVSRASSAFTHTITYKFGSASGTICTKSSSTSVSWTPPLTLANQVPNATSGVGTLTCDTYNGSTKIGSKSISFTLNVPSGVVPTIGSFTTERVNNSVPSGWGIYVKGKSQCKLKINSPEGAYGSTIKSYSIKQGSTVLASSASVTTPVLNTTGTITFTAIVTDSRGRTASKTASISVVDYVAPSITSILTQRCTSDGTVQDDGTFIRCLCKFTFASCSGKNSASGTVQFRKVGDSNWSTGESFSSNVVKVIGGEVDIDNSYEVRFQVEDAFGGVVQIDVVSTSFSTMEFRKGGKGIAFGKASEKEDTFECAFEAEFGKGLDVGGHITFDGGNQKGERDIYFQSTEGTYPHKASIYGGSPESRTAIGLWDNKNSRRIMSYDDVSNTIYLGHAGTAPQIYFGSMTISLGFSIQFFAMSDLPNKPSGVTSWGRGLRFGANADADKYYLLVDGNGKLFTGTQLNGATKITWYEK